MKKLCIVFTAVLGLVLMLSGITYALLFKPNFTRFPGPYTEKHNQKHWENKQFEERSFADAAWWEASDRERLEITSYDGLKLVAYYLAPEQHKGIVLMFHGFQSLPSRDFSSIARFYYEHGYAICLPYQRTHGESEGRYITFGVKERFDVRDWINELNERYGMENDIWVHGISMGCASVLMASGFGFPFNVRGIIADCGFTSPAEIITTVLKHRRVPLAPFFASFGNVFAKLLAGFSLYDYDTYRALAVNETPVLFIHGTGDDFVPAAMTWANWEVCHAPKSLLLVDDAKHAMSFFQDEEAYTSELQAFFSQHALPR